MDVPNMMSRYKMKSRASLYKRMKFLGIELLKNYYGKAFATENQLMLLDRLHEHINRGHKMSTFAMTTTLDMTPSYDDVQVKRQQNIQAKRQQDTKVEIQEEIQTATSENLIKDVVKEVVANINQPKSVLEKHSVLEECYQNEWFLTTKEVEEILNRKPRKVKGGDYCIMNGWKFVAKGRDRSQNIWQVQRMDD